MRLAVSNIAWTASEDEAVAAILLARGVNALEVAPGRLFPDVAAATPADAKAMRQDWRACGFDLVAMQALLFGRPELRLFGNEDIRRAFADHMAHIIRLAGALGCGPLVFGSPKNRLRDGRTQEQAEEEAADVLRPLARLAHDENCTIAFEPNAADYGCDFARRVADADRLVQRIDHPGCTVQLDAGVFTMEDDAMEDVRNALPRISHFHASAPSLAPSEENIETIVTLAETLRSAGYSGLVSVEMRGGQEGETAMRMATTLDALQARGIGA